jgi:glucosyl-3-phosphoglycerate synthase
MNGCRPGPVERRLCSVNGASALRDDVAGWVRRRTTSAAQLPTADELVARADGRTVALVVPARDEAATVGDLVSSVLAEPALRALLSEVVVVDSRSRDRTAAVARAAGARVVSTADVALDHPDGGKGGAVWRGVLATAADLLVVVDADLDPFDPAWVAALVAPLLLDDSVALVKAAADRPFTVDGAVADPVGGRVTELVARPLLSCFWPQLTGVAQPLAGEMAARRDLLVHLPFAMGYGLEIGLLVDTLEAVGLDAIAQVDVGQRRHRHRSNATLGCTAVAVLRTALARAGVPAESAPLVQFSRDAAGSLLPSGVDVEVGDLPPLAGLA